MRHPLLAALLVLAFLASPGGAWSADKKTPAGTPPEKATEVTMGDWGQPKGLKKGEPTFWLWYEKDYWYLRTTGDKNGNRFQGQLTVAGGKLVDLAAPGGERKGKAVDAFVFNAARDVMQFDFRTGTSYDGLNFKPDDAATSLTFAFRLDGKADKDRIKIGKAGAHPESSVFTVPARPVSKPAEPTKPKPKK